MGTALPLTRMTEDAYLDFEQASDEKHEYYRGEIFAMAGASLNHNRIVKNAVWALENQLRGKPCEVFPSDLRLYCIAPGLYTYPDVSVVCPPVLYHRDRHDTVTNPRLLIEVLSPSTQDYDRGQKFEFYRSIGSLQELLLVSSVRMQVLQYTRQNDFQWHLSEYTAPDAVLELSSLGVSLRLNDLYERVVFEAESPAA